MKSFLPQSGNPVVPGLPWYKQIQHGLNLIEYGPDYKNWERLLRGKQDENVERALAAGASITGVTTGGFAIFSAITKVASLSVPIFAGITAGALAMTGVGVLAAGAILVSLANRDDADRFSLAVEDHIKWDWKPNLIGNSLYKGIYRKAAKIYTVASVEDDCRMLLSMLVDEQIDFYVKKLKENKAVKPEITDIKKFYMGAGRGILFSQDLNSGKRKVEVPLEGTTEGGKTVLSYEEAVGDVRNVDPNPYNTNERFMADINWNEAVGGFYIEK